MKKTILVVALAIIAFAGITIAIGETYSPTEFKAINFDTYSLNPKPTNTALDGQGEGTVFIQNYTTETFQQTTNELTASEEYKKIETQQKAVILISDYVNCRMAGSTQTECEKQIKTETIERIKSQQADELRNLKEMQAKAEVWNAYAKEFNPNNIRITPADITSTTQTGE